MQSLQVSAVTIASLVNGNQADILGKNAGGTGKKSGGDQFSSLLDVVGNLGDGTTKKDAQKDDRKDNVRDPVASILEQPIALRSTPKKDDLKNNLGNDIGKADDSRFVQKVLSTAAKANKKSDDSDASQRVNTEDKIQLKQRGDTSDASDDVSKSIDADDGEEDILKAENSQRADDISNLIDIFTQLLAGAGNINAEATQIDGQATQDVAQKISDVGNINAEATQIDGQVIQDVAQKISGAGNINAEARQIDGQATQGVAQKVLDVVAVFSNLNDNLSKLKDFLLAANAQNTPLSKEQTDVLNKINNALENDLGALKNLFPQGLDQSKPLFSQILQGADQTNTLYGEQQNLTKAEESLSLLENDILPIRELLQNFKDKNSLTAVKTDAATEKQNIPVNTLDTALDALNSNNNGESRRAEILAISSAVSTQVANQPANQVQNNQNIILSSNLVQVANSNASFDSNSGGNSGQGSNGQAQSAIGGLSQTSAKISENLGSSQFSNLLNRTTQTPVVEQVAFQVKSAVASGNSKITIQLNPEDLGKLDITLDIDSKGKTGVTITADNKQTLDLLQRDAQALQKALSDAGLKADSGSLSFNLRGGEREGQGQNQNESHAASKYQKSQPEELLPEELNIASIATITRNYIVNIPDGLNIKI